MLKRRLPSLLLPLACIAGQLHAADGVVVIGDARLARLDLATLEKVYTGKVIEVDGITVTAVNAASGSPVRNRFLRTYLKQD